MQTNNSYIKIIRQHTAEQVNKHKNKANKIKRIITKKEWQ